MVNQNSNAAMAALYGAAATHSEYTRWTNIRYRDDGGAEKTGMIMWICEASADSPIMYVIERPGWPEFIYAGDILGTAEVESS